jgi:hypothetical protein
MEHVIRGLFKCWIRIRNCCKRRPKTLEYKTYWFKLYNDGMFELVYGQPKFTDDTFAIFQSVVRTKPSGQKDERCAIHYKDKFGHYLENSELFDPVQPPWLMITCDGEDFTEVLHDYICRGNTITLEMLKLKYAKGEWSYLDPKTFEDVDFPSEGIVIN